MIYTYYYYMIAHPLQLREPSPRARAEWRFAAGDVYSQGNNMVN